MNATTHPTATWTETPLGGFTVAFGPKASFGVGYDGRYLVALPGHGMRSCWNRSEVERTCLGYLAQLQAETDADEWAGSKWDREASAADRRYQQIREGV